VRARKGDVVWAGLVSSLLASSSSSSLVMTQRSWIECAYPMLQPCCLKPVLPRSTHLERGSPEHVDGVALPKALDTLGAKHVGGGGERVPGCLLQLFGGARGRGRRDGRAVGSEGEKGGGREVAVEVL
jgi:hypothetical protein